MNKNRSRRNFLRISTLGSGVLFSIKYFCFFPQKNGQNTSGREVNQSFNFEPFIEIHTDNTVTFFSTKHEMGQSVSTALAMIISEELGCNWEDVRIERAKFDTKYTRAMMGTTGGSRSVNNLWPILRRAGASVKEMLKLAAAKRWKIDSSNLIVKDGYVINPVGEQKLSYSSLASEASTLDEPINIELKSIEQFQLIGKPVKNKLARKISRGENRYGFDFEIPGMLYASIERCPVLGGRLKDFDASEVRVSNGVVDVVPIGSLVSTASLTSMKEGVAVLGNSTWAVINGRKRLRCQWVLGSNSQRNISTLKDELKKGAKTARIVNIQGVPPGTAGIKIIEADYFSPYQIHASMEPLNCTVFYDGEQCEAWIGSQSGQVASAEIAKITGLPPSKIKVNILDSGGAFGRRFHHDFLIEATFLSFKLKKPIKLIWTREDDTAHDHYHPYEFSSFIAHLDLNKGKLLGWENTIVTTGYNYSGDQISEIPYEIPFVRTKRKAIKGPIPIGAWRSVQEHSGCYARESFIDEIAHHLKKDPFLFRWGLIKEIVNSEMNNNAGFREQHASKLDKICEFIEENELWPSSPEGLGIGIAIQTYVTGTPCALIAKVSRNNAGFKVDEIACIIHCGIVVNPHHAKNQVEGSIIFGLSAFLYGGVEIENGKVMRSNFHNNKVLRMNETLKIEVHFIESKDTPTGLGEPATAAVAPAVNNAIFDLTGERFRTMPV